MIDINDDIIPYDDGYDDTLVTIQAVQQQINATISIKQRT